MYGGRRVARSAAGTASRLWPYLRWPVAAGVLFGVYELLLRHDFASAGKSVSLLAKVSPLWVCAAVVLEVACLVADAQLTHLMFLPHSPGRCRTLRTNLTTLAVGHVVPGGTSASSVAAYRLYTGQRVPGSTAAVGLAVRGVGSALVLNALFWVAVVASVPLNGFNSVYGLVAAGGVGTFGLLACAGVVISRRSRRTEGARSEPCSTNASASGPRRAAPDASGGLQKLLRVGLGRLRPALRAGSERLRVLSTDRRLLATASGWAAANWLLDAASLWVFLFAFGHATPPVDLLVAYGLANVLAALPVTPSGLGIVEGTLVASLTAFHVPSATAVFGVLAYRLVQFWLPVPAGALSYLSLRGEGLRRSAGSSAMSLNVASAPASRSAGVRAAKPNTVISAARAASTPRSESSITTHFAGATPIRVEARRKRSGAGLPLATSSAPQ